MDDVQIEELDWRDSERVHAARALIASAFENPERYGAERLEQELQQAAAPFYRQLFVATRLGQVVGVAGVKAADWASDTHILYLSAVARAFRGQGIGRSLVEARLDWLTASFKRGRILVSTGKPRRFKSLKFRIVTGSRKDGRWLMMREIC